MEKTERTVKELPFKVLLIGIFFFIAVFVFAYLAEVVVVGKKDLFDTAIFNFLKAHTTPSLIEWMKGITFFGSAAFLLPSYIILVAVLYFKNQKRLALDVALVGISSDGLKWLLKDLFQRHRPDLPLIKTLKTYSFPSGHALSSFVFFSILVYVLWKEDIKTIWKWILSLLLILFSFVIGTSRVVLRFHYASDVIAGFCVGFSWVILSLWLLNKLHFLVQRKRN